MEKRQAKLVEKYGLDYQARFKEWSKAQQQDPDTYVCETDLVRALVKKGIVERIRSPKPYGAVVYRIKTS